MMKNLSIKIIPMTRSHIPACALIIASSEPWKTLRERLDFLPFIKKKQAYVAIIEDAVTGFVIFTSEPVFARGGYLRAIAVAPAIRGSGIGSKLLSFAERTTRKQAPNFYLCVSSFNKEGQAFYRKSGYQMVGKLKDLIRKDASEHIYWKKLRLIKRMQPRS
jgi:ribosomal protein S18 acetylase RimI-like enzyme